jgi:hypothetical protein
MKGALVRALVGGSVATAGWIVITLAIGDFNLYATIGTRALHGLIFRRDAIPVAFHQSKRQPLLVGGTDAKIGG